MFGILIISTILAILLACITLALLFPKYEADVSIAHFFCICFCVTFSVIGGCSGNEIYNQLRDVNDTQTQEAE